MKEIVPHPSDYAEELSQEGNVFSGDGFPSQDAIGKDLLLGRIIQKVIDSSFQLVGSPAIETGVMIVGKLIPIGTNIISAFAGVSRCTLESVLESRKDDEEPCRKMLINPETSIELIVVYHGRSRSRCVRIL